MVKEAMFQALTNYVFLTFNVQRANIKAIALIFCG